MEIITIRVEGENEKSVAEAIEKISSIYKLQNVSIKDWKPKGKKEKLKFVAYANTIEVDA